VAGEEKVGEVLRFEIYSLASDFRERVIALAASNR